ncbi:unnamed protein product, partial [Acidithrix sp. C25]
VFGDNTPWQNFLATLDLNAFLVTALETVKRYLILSGS